MSKRKRKPIVYDSPCATCAGDCYFLRCPACGHIDTLQGYDVLGADDGNLFCTQCGHEAPMDDAGPCAACGGSGFIIRV